MRGGPRFWDQRLDWREVGSVVVDGDDDEEAETEDRCGAEGEDRPRRAAGAGHGGGSRRALRFTRIRFMHGRGSCWTPQRERSIPAGHRRRARPRAGYREAAREDRAVEVENSFLTRKPGDR